MAEQRQGAQAPATESEVGHQNWESRDLSGMTHERVAFVDVDLSGASLHTADLCGADLRGSDLSALDPGTTPLRGAIIDVQQAIVLAGTVGFDVRPTDERLPSVDLSTLR